MSATAIVAGSSSGQAFSCWNRKGNYTRLYFGEHRPLIRRSLAALEQQLDPTLFYRANRKQILNFASIARTETTDNGRLIASLREGPRVEISRRQSEQLRSKLKL